MADAALIEAFIRKWETRILAALDNVGEEARRAGYATMLPDADVDVDAMPPRLMWIMRTWYPSRPEELESMDVFLTFSLLPADDEGIVFAPVAELLNVEGSFADDIELGEPLRLDDDRSIASALEAMQAAAGDIVTRLEAYFPKAAKRVWKIKVVGPGGKSWPPSVTTNEDFAKAEVAGLLNLSLDRISRLFWELETVREFYAWNTGTTAAVARIEMFLEQGETWDALREYDKMIKSLTPALRNRVIRRTGTITVETTGGYA